jgi:glutathione S-transferase
MGMELYGRRSSINVQKVIWCLAELGLIEGHDFQRIDAGQQFGVVNTPEFLALNPNGLVPVLVDDDVVLWESNTIVRYLASSRAEGALLPRDAAARADVECWMDWQLGTLWATLRVAFLGLTRVPETERNYDAIKASHWDAARLLRIADGVLRNRRFLAQQYFTVADIGTALAAVRWFVLSEQFADVVEECAEMPFLKDWLTRVTDRPAYRVAMAQ